jgi:hypothetical protein
MNFHNEILTIYRKKAKVYADSCFIGSFINWADHGLYF